MKWIVEDSLANFEFWSGAKQTVQELSYSKLTELDDILPDVFGGETPTDTEINDLFWFEEDTIAELLGYADWEDLLEDR